MGEDRGFDLFRPPAGMGALGAGQAVDPAVRPIGLVVPLDFIKLLTGIAHQLAGLADVAQLCANSSKDSFRRATFFSVVM